ncbi:MAG: SprB repeat-containing protein [Bacteroidetes bacterium]|nr:SprB repeat-containing protein [Bacteroidota bacterium]
MPIDLVGHEICSGNGNLPFNITYQLSDYNGFGVSCNNASDGSVDLTVNGGIAPYSFNWSNGSTNEDINNLSAGVYKVIITDAVSDTDSIEITINEPPALIIITDSIINPPCYGISNGSIYISVAGGVGNYIYNWSGGQTTEDINNLGAFDYTITITDDNGCQVSDLYTIIQPSLLNLIVDSINNQTCGQANSGNIFISVSGGAAPMNYIWSDGSSDNDRIGIPPGTYFVTATDQNGCSDTAWATVLNVPPPIIILDSLRNVSCNAINDGAIYLSVDSGSPPFNYLWSNGATVENITNLSSGLYTITVIDSLSCLSSLTFSISEPSQLFVVADSVINLQCNGNSTGAIYTSIIGGTGPFSYNWSNGATIEDISGLIATTYSLTVTDANGCLAYLNKIISQPSALLAAIGSFSNPDCNGFTNGSINLSISGGFAPYLFLWSNAASTQNLVGLAAGTYTVTVTDANGCTKTASQILTQPSTFDVIISNFTNVSCNGASNGTINITASGGTTPYGYVWSNGSTIQNQTGLVAGTYTVTVTDANGCTKTASQILTQPSTFDVIISNFTNVGCNGASNGTINITAR